MSKVLPGFMSDSICCNQLTVVEVVVVKVVVFVAEGSVAEVVVLYGVSLIGTVGGSVGTTILISSFEPTNVATVAINPPQTLAQSVLPTSTSGFVSTS